MRRSYICYVIACVMAAAAPFIFAGSHVSSNAGNVPFSGEVQLSVSSPLTGDTVANVRSHGISR